MFLCVFIAFVLHFAHINLFQHF